jgi:hypothetical protein
MKPKRKPKVKKDIYKMYRTILEMPALTEREIDQMRVNLRSIARAVCEHVWKKKFY